jgi:hypothetical protein
VRIDEEAFMGETPGAKPVADEKLERDPDHRGEVSTRFTTKGHGSSGPENKDDKDY